MGTVVNLVPEAYDQRLRQFENDRQLGRFLSALDAIAPVSTMDETAVETWERLADSVESDEPLTEVLNWVANYRFSYLEARPKREEVPSDTMTEEQRARLAELGKMVAEAYLALDSELEGLRVENPVYGRFPGVLPFLRRPDAPWFPAISEPAKVIGAFIESLYPEDAVTPERATAAEQPWLGGYVAEILLPWAIERERGGKSRYSAESLSRIEAFVPLIPTLFEIHFEFLDPQTWGDRFDPESVVGALIHLPQAMFDRVLWETSWDPNRDDLEFPVDPDQPGEEERAARAIIEIFELASVLPISGQDVLSWKSIPSSVEHHFDALARIDQVPRMLWGRHKHWAFNALFCGLDDYTVPDLVAHVGCLANGMPFDEEDLARSLRRVARKLGRLDPYRSVAEVGYGDCGFVGDALSNAMKYVNGDFSSANFVLLLGQDETFGFGDEGSIGSPELLEWGPDYARLAAARTAIFRVAIDSAFDEGFVSLGCALTAFYLPTQVLAYEENAAFNWSWLAEAIDRAQQWDHEGHVQASVEATVQILDGLAEGETSQSVHRMNLSRFLAESRSRGSIDKDELKQSLLELREDQDVRAERLLEEYIGSANARWMEGKDKAVLRELAKETARARDEGQLVCGSPVPGMLLTQWFKFLEERLVRVYDGIVMAECGPSPDREFGIRGGVADRLAVLEGKGGVKAQRLEEIRDSLPPGLRDDDLLDFLQRFRRARNKAAHEETPVLPGAFEEIFQEMVDGRLREFVEGVLL